MDDEMRETDWGERFAVNRQVARSKFMGLVALAIRAGLEVPKAVREDFLDWRAEQHRLRQAAIQEIEAREVA